MSHLPPNVVTAIKEHDHEPVHGLPAPLPEGETILWQGAPDWRVLARRGLRVRLVACYFAVLIAWGILAGIEDRAGVPHLALAALRLAALGGAACAILTLYAVLVARSTVYTVTTRRVVIRFGVALPMTVQIAYATIDAAGLRQFADGSGDIALTLRPGHRVAYAILWPHVRPWKLTKAQPALRAVPDAAGAARILARALAASAGQPAHGVGVTRGARTQPAGAMPATA